MLKNRKRFIIISLLTFLIVSAVLGYFLIYLPNNKKVDKNGNNEQSISQEETENNSQDPDANAVDNHLEKEQVISNNPTAQRIVISKLNLDAAIVEVGLTENRVMESPASDYDVGWYIYGQMPGEIGTAIMAGHGGTGTDGVFAHIDELQVGDIVSIVNGDGSTIQFEVIKSKVYGKDDDATEVFTNNNGAYLNLITCYGTWDSNIQTVQDRLVVFTKKI